MKMLGKYANNPSHCLLTVLALIYCIAFSFYQPKLLQMGSTYQLLGKKNMSEEKNKTKKIVRVPARLLNSLPPCFPTQRIELTQHTGPQSVYVSRALCIIVLRILRGLKKGQQKEIYFWNKTKMFSSFLLILMHVLHHGKQSSPQRGL